MQGSEPGISPASAFCLDCLCVLLRVAVSGVPTNLAVCLKGIQAGFEPAVIWDSHPLFLSSVGLSESLRQECIRHTPGNIARRTAVNTYTRIDLSCMNILPKVISIITEKKLRTY